MAISFKRLAEADLPTLAEWLNRPHVAERWDGCRSLEEVREKYLPRLEDISPVAPYFAYLNDVPIGYIQSYVAMGGADGWWPEERDPGVRGIDLFVADPNLAGQGLGTAMIREFVDLLFRDPSVTRIQADPAPDNNRAIRCYEKVGFKRVGRVTTPDGPALLMAVGR